METFEVTYILDQSEETMNVLAANERDARYQAQQKFGSPVEIVGLRKV